MDPATRRLLNNIPNHLQRRGWRFFAQDSRPSGILASRWYIVVYRRPYEPDIDIERFARPTRDGYVEASTSSSRSPSWEQAYRDAIERMESIDSKRQDHSGKQLPQS
jgi:hypothetical protein